MKGIDWKTVSEAVAAVVRERGVTTVQLAAWTGLSRSTVQGAVGGNSDAQWGTAVKILDALGLDLCWVHQLGGSPCPRSSRKADKTTSRGRARNGKPTRGASPSR